MTCAVVLRACSSFSPAFRRLATSPDWRSMRLHLQRHSSPVFNCAAAGCESWPRGVEVQLEQAQSQTHADEGRELGLGLGGPVHQLRLRGCPSHPLPQHWRAAPTPHPAMPGVGVAIRRERIDVIDGAAYCIECLADWCGD